MMARSGLVRDILEAGIGRNSHDLPGPGIDRIDLAGIAEPGQVFDDIVAAFPGRPRGPDDGDALRLEERPQAINIVFHGIDDEAAGYLRCFLP